MTEQEIEHKIQKIIDWHDELDDLFDKLEDSPLGLSAESKLFETAWKLFDEYKNEVGLAINGNYLEWLSWFVYENNCGRNKFTITITDSGGNEKTFKIKNAKDMSKYLVWEREQNNE